MMKNDLILIIDGGGQYTQILARHIRNRSVYSEIRNGKITIEEIKKLYPKGIIFSIGENSNLDKMINDVTELNIPILKVYKEDIKEFSQNDERLEDFLFNICACSKNWTASNFVTHKIEEIKATVGDKKVLCALSGGVDSSVVAALVSKAIGKNLICIFVDTGLMRKNEGDEVEKAFKGNFDAIFVRVHAQERFLNRLKGVTDPEEKRKIIGEEFIRVFEEEAKKIGKVDFLTQGTIYPDIIESGTEDGKVIKSHHNVGGLPDVVDFQELIEPLNYLFKEEVRELGRELNLSEELVSRQPFPGPGLGIRVIGEVTKEKLDILREADYIFREEIRNAGLDGKINQYFAVITDLKSVGVKNNVRTYDYTLALRAVETQDFMTARWSRIDYDVLEKASSRITNEVEHINRIVYDITSKPPATIEWE